MLLHGVCRVKWKASFAFAFNGDCRGVALPANRWRFVEWRKADEPNVYELYDHRTDPQENENLANKPEHAGRLQELSAMLHKKLGSRR
jgi:iduronate 2-sulfatase